MAKQKAVENGDTLVRATSKYAIPLQLLLPPRSPDAEGPRHYVGGCKGSNGSVCEACKMLRALQKAQREVTLALNVAVRHHHRLDSDLLDAFLRANQRFPKKGEIEWPPGMKRDSPAYTYGLIRETVPQLSSHIAASIQKIAAEHWSRYRFDILFKHERSVPVFQEAPIPIAAATMRLEHHEGKQFRLNFTLSAGREGEGKFALVVEARDARQERELNAIVTGEWKRGVMQIVHDPKRYNRWYFRVSYKRTKPPVPAVERVMGINRGIRCHLAWAAFDGSSDYDAGTDIVSTLKGFQRRRRVYQAQARWSNRGGHGRKRILKPIARLEDKGKRWRANVCQTRARAFARVCVQKGISVVGIEDFQGIRNKLPEHYDGGERVYQLVQEFPYYQQQTRIISCLEEVGIRHVILPAQGISKTCPECQFASEANIDWKEHFFRCRECGFRRHLDVVAAINIRDRARESIAGLLPPGPVREPPPKAVVHADDDEVILPLPKELPKPAEPHKKARARPKSPFRT